MKTGEVIRALRKEKGWTQTELGAKLGVKTNAVSKWECGRVYDIPSSKVKAMAKLFDVPVSYIVDANKQNDKTLDGIREHFESGRQHAEDLMHSAFGSKYASLSTWLSEEDATQVSILYYNTFPKKSSSSVADILMMLQGQDPDVVENIMYIVDAYLRAGSDAKAIVDLALKPYIEQEKEAREELETGI